MDSNLYKFNFKIGILDQKTFAVRDYFEYYTTGVESLIDDYPSFFAITTRLDNERPENIMKDMFNNSDMSDTFVAINNENYLWSTPYNLNAFHDAVEFRMNYVELLMRDRVIRTTEKNHLGTEVRDANNKPIIHYNQVGDLCKDKVTADIESEDEAGRTIIIPEGSNLAFVDRKIKDYFKSRKVR